MAQTTPARYLHCLVNYERLTPPAVRYGKNNSERSHQSPSVPRMRLAATFDKSNCARCTSKSSSRASESEAWRLWTNRCFRDGAHHGCRQRSSHLHRTPRTQVCLILESAESRRAMESRDLAGLSLRCRRIACRPREILCYDYLLTTPPTHSSDNRSRHPKSPRSRGARSLAPSGNRAVSL